MYKLWQFFLELLGRLLLTPFRSAWAAISALSRPLARTASGLCLIAAAVAFAHDIGPASVGGRTEIRPASVARHWEKFAPKSLEATRTVVTQRLGAWVWRMVSMVLALPTVLVFAALCIGLGYYGRRRRKVEIFAN